tara:strand:+ start:533 stop:1168 length:636 start_codon:yes stop_codon:yes gene_type:complete
MSDEQGEAVGLVMGFQAGALIGLYLGFSLATISVLTDAENIQRTISLICTPPFILSIVLGPFLAKRRRPVMMTKEPLIEAREKLSKFNEGQGNWRSLSHISSDGVNLRIDMHNLKDVESVVDAALELAEKTTVKFIVGRGNHKSSSPELRNKVLKRVEDSVGVLRRTRKAKSIEVNPVTSNEYNQYQNRLNRILLILLPIVSFLAWLEMRN